VAGGGETAHIGADLGEDHLGTQGADARDGAQQLDRCAKGREPGLDLFVDLGDRRFQGLHLPQVQRSRKRCWGATRPRSASSSVSRDALTR
jgi:hypothetical protein